MRPAAMLLAMMVALGAGGVVDVLVPPAPRTLPVEVAQPAPGAGFWYCPATDPQHEAVLSVAAVGDDPAVVVVERYAEGIGIPDAPVQVSAGDQFDVVLPPPQAGSPLKVEWRGGPAVATWRVDDRATAACLPRPSPRWLLSGFETAGGSRSAVHLFNPFSVDAVARVTFNTPEGREALLLTDNVVVPAGVSVRLDLNEVQPEQPDLGVIVEVLAGRLVAQGELVLDPPGQDPGPRGRGLISAAEEPVEQWALAFARVDDGSQTWLSIQNPTEREAAVEIRVSDPSPESFGEVSVPAGGVTRVDLAGLSEEAEFGVSATSVNEVPVVVSRVTSIRTPAGRQGVAASLATQAATDWALAGGGAGDRQGRISLFNPGPEPVEVDVWASGETPESWSGIHIPPNGRTAVHLADVDPERHGIAARVEASAPIVAELRSLHSAGPLRLWSDVGVASLGWTGPAGRPVVNRDPALRTRPFPGPESEPDSGPVDGAATPD